LYTLLPLDGNMDGENPSKSCWEWGPSLNGKATL
jgi:hypothetical protein